MNKFKKNNKMKAIATALVKAQSEMSNPAKGNTNPFFKSKYADLNAVREAVIPVLNANGITVLQPMKNVDGKNYVNTILLHESGEQIESFTEIIYSKQNDAQAQGSGITYARRYGLQSFVCVGADDDDGNKASQPAKIEPKIKPIMVIGSSEYERAVTYLAKGGKISGIELNHTLTAEVKTSLTNK